MPIEIQFGIFYFMTIFMFALPITVYEIFAAKICITWTMPFRMGQGKMEIYQTKANKQHPMCWQY